MYLQNVSVFSAHTGNRKDGMSVFKKVEICGVNTATLKVLTEAEKIELLRKMQQGDSHAREALVNGNLRLVLSIIQRFTGRGENLDDLFQVGCIGLIKAIDNFDLSLDVRFSTYAVPTVIECRNPGKDLERYDPKNRITKGNFATFGRREEYRDLRETKRHFRGYAAYQLDR